MVVAHHDRERCKHGGALDLDCDRGPAAAARCGTGAQEPTWHLRRWTGLEPRTQLRCRRDAMNRMIGLVALCLALGACASTRPAPDIALDERSEEHTSELQSLMRISYAVFCLKKKKQTDKE